MDDVAARDCVARAEALIGQIEAFSDAQAKETSLAAVQALLELYGEGLARIVAELSRRDAGVLDTIAADELVAHLLLLHGLHPLDLETRVRQALDAVRPYLASHGGDVGFDGLQGDVARLRLRGSCHGCPSSAMTLKLAIEDALLRAAPDLGGLEVEGVVEAPQGQPVLFVDGAAPARGATWDAIGHLSQFAVGRATVREIDGEPLIVVKLAETLYAYRRRCPACGGDVDVAEQRATSNEQRGGAAGSGAGDADISSAELVCAGCAARYDIRRHGAGTTDPALSLEPVPLLVGRDGSVKVALGAIAV